jgi:hypothetical protein
VLDDSAGVAGEEVFDLLVGAQRMKFSLGARLRSRYWRLYYSTAEFYKRMERIFSNIKLNIIKHKKNKK